MTIDDRPDEAFAHFFMANYHKLVKSVFFSTGDKQLAEDIAQDVMATLANYRYDRPEVLMYRMAKQRLKRAYVPLQYQPLDEASVEADPRLSVEGADSVIDSQIGNRELMEALRALPNRQKEVIVLHVGCDLSLEQVAEILGISVSAAKTHKTRGMEKLKQLKAGRLEAKEPGAEQPVGGTQNGY